MSLLKAVRTSLPDWTCCWGHGVLEHWSVEIQDFVGLQIGRRTGSFREQKQPTKDHEKRVQSIEFAPFPVTDAEGGTRTPTGCRPPPPQDGVSTNSTTSALPLGGLLLFSDPDPAVIRAPLAAGPLPPRESSPRRPVARRSDWPSGGWTRKPAEEMSS